jgi:hypothetical protein
MMSTTNCLNANYRGTNVTWFETGVCKDIFLRLNDEPYLDSETFITDYAEAQRYMKWSIQADPCCKDVMKTCERNNTVELSESDWMEDGSAQINKNRVWQAVQKRLPSFSPPSKEKEVYLSQSFITNVFKPAIPNTPLVPIANYLADRFYGLGALSGALLMLPEMVLRSLINLGLNLTINIQQHNLNLEDAELLKLRTWMNYNAPFQTFARCCHHFAPFQLFARGCHRILIA